MEKLIQASTYRGLLKAPPSKSFMQRAIALALLADGETILTNPSFCDDAKAALKMATCLGASIKQDSDRIVIRGATNIKKRELSAGASGLGIRCFIAIAALYSDEIIFSGENSLESRPLAVPEASLKKLGVSIETNEGYLPVKIKGPIKGGKVEMNASISSQVLTGLLIALPKAKGNSTITVQNLQSIPYIDMTLQIIEAFGGHIVNHQHKVFNIKGNQTYSNGIYDIEGDWSSVSSHLVGAAISGNVEICGINTHSSQGDRAMVDVLKSVGAQVEILPDTIKVRKGLLRPFTFDASNCPDLFPSLSNLAAACSGTSIINGVKRLIYKESNRALVLQSEWAKLGIDIDIIGDEMHIKGGIIKGGEINTHSDHRIAMMGAIAGLIAVDPVRIVQAEVVSKSYPNFFKDFDHLTHSKQQ